MSDEKILADLIRVRDETERYQRFIEFYQSQSKQPLSILRSSLLDQSPSVKMVILRYLEEIPEPQAIEWTLICVGDFNEFVRKRAQKALELNSCRKKYLVLRKNVRNPVIDISVLSIRMLARLGDQFILPTLWEQLSESSAKVQHEALKALCLLLDKRSVRFVTPFIDHPEEKLRAQSVRTLTALNDQYRSISGKLFMKCLQDPSQKVQQAALEALEKFPSKNIEALFLTRALHEKEFDVRLRALRALPAFSKIEMVHPLLAMIIEESNPRLKLTAEISLRQFPKPLLKKALLELLKNSAPKIRYKSAYLLAQVFPEIPAVRQRLFELWKESTEPAHLLAMIEVMKELGDPEIIPLILKTLDISPILSYAALGTLNRLKAFHASPDLIRILKDPKYSHLIKQSILTTLTKKGVGENVKQDLFEYLKVTLDDPVENIRYLCVQVLGWYPFEQCFPLYLRQLAKEKEGGIAEYLHGLFIKNLKQNPLPLMAEIERSEHFDSLLPHLFKILETEKWKEGFIVSVLKRLISPPYLLHQKNPEALVSIGITFLNKGTISFQTIWPYFDLRPLKLIFLETLRNKVKESQGVFPKMSFQFLFPEYSKCTEKERALLFEVIGLNQKISDLPLVAGLLVEEQEVTALSAGKKSLKSLVQLMAQ